MLQCFGARKDTGEGVSTSTLQRTQIQTPPDHLGFVLTGRPEGGDIYSLTTAVTLSYNITTGLLPLGLRPGAPVAHLRAFPRSCLPPGALRLGRSQLRFLSRSAGVSATCQRMSRLYYCCEGLLFGRRHGHNTSLFSPS